MRRVSLLSFTLVLAGLAGAVAPTESAAQLKPKLPGKLGRALGGNDQPSAVPRFNDRTIEITERHVSAVLAGLRMQNDSLAARWSGYLAARQAYDDSAKAYPGLRAEYERSRSTWEECQEREVKPATAAAERDVARAQEEATGGDPAAMQTAMEAVAERVKAAQQRGDMAEVMRLVDSIQKGSVKTTQAVTQASNQMQAAAERCGAEPQEPDEPRAPVYDRSVLPIPRDPALWASEEQYGVMFDRLEPLLAIEKEADFDTALRAAFSDAEQQAIGTQAGALRAEMARRRALLANG